MTDPFTAATKLQKQMMAAQQAQLDAAQAMLDGSKQAMAMQEAGKKALDAQVRLWTAWAGMWGWM